MVDLTQPLTSPVVLNDGTVLQDLSDASLWLLNCEESDQPELKAAARCLLDAADGGDVVVASNVLRFAAFTMGKLKVM